MGLSETKWALEPGSWGSSTYPGLTRKYRWISIKCQYLSNWVDSHESNLHWVAKVYPRDPQRAGWILIFVVKGSKHRIVFDSKVTFKGKVINECLLQGPDMNNSIRGEIVRFRRFVVGFYYGIKAMYNRDAWGGQKIPALLLSQGLRQPQVTWIWELNCNQTFIYHFVRNFV